MVRKKRELGAPRRPGPREEGAGLDAWVLQQDDVKGSHVSDLSSCSRSSTSTP